jgi:molybdopterin biosynthesis enzyme
MKDELQAPQRIARLTPVVDVIDRIAALVTSVAPRDVAVADAAGRVLAADMTAVHNLPMTAIVLRDGYAVASETTADAGGYTPVLLSAVHRVSAGDPLPPGTDAVAMPDAVALQGDRLEIQAQITPGEGVLPPQGDVRAGTVLLKAGARLRAIDIAVLSVAGIERVPIRAPRILLLRATANADALLVAASAMIARVIAADGAELMRADEAARNDLATDMEHADADAIVVIGGSGSGAADRSVHTLTRVGGVEAHGIAIAPGETAAFGLIGSRPVLILPGRIDAALAVWLVLGRPMLAKLGGSAVPDSTVTAKLTRKLASSLGLTEVIPVRIHTTGAEPIASGYLPLSSLAQSDGWILIAADSEGYPPGTEVVIRAWP